VPQFSNEFVRRIQVPVYLIVAYLSVGSAIELVVAGWPLHLHDVNFRLGLLNSAAAASGTELLALLLLVVMGQLAQSVATLWAGFWYCILVAVAYLGVAGTFVLDALQLRGRIPAAEAARFDVTVAWALGRFAIAEVVCLALASCALYAARSLRRESPRDGANRLVVGVPGAGTAPITR
jgi:hypothetical protein